MGSRIATARGGNESILAHLSLHAQPGALNLITIFSAGPRDLSSHRVGAEWPIGLSFNRPGR